MASQYLQELTAVSSILSSYVIPITDDPSGTSRLKKCTFTQIIDFIESSIDTVGKVTITQPATSSTLTISNGKTLTCSNTLTLTATDGSTLAIGSGGTLGTAAYTAASAYEVPLTFSTGLTRSTNTITVNTSQNIATLSNLTSNGLVTTSGGAGTLGITTLDTDGTLSSNSDSRVATQKAVKTYIDASVTGLLDFKGSTDCSTNPNYPSASKGDAYYVSVAGKIGGVSGKSVEIGDVYVANADNGGGTEASVGTSWFVLEHNLVGAAVTSGTLAQFATTTSSELASIISDETGSGALVFATSPTLVTPNIGAATATTVNGVTITGSGTLATGSGNTLTLTGNSTINQNVTTTGSPQFSNIGIGVAATTLAPINISKTITDPASSYAVINIASTTNTVTADNATAFIGMFADVRVNQNGFNLNNVAAIRGTNSYAFASGSSGTVAHATGVFAYGGNTGAGTLTNFYGFHAYPALNSGGGTLTANHGFYCAAQTSGTNIYGFRGVIASAANRWNIYMDGTALNYLNGGLQIGHTGTALGKLESRATAGAQIAASYDGSNYATITVASNGATTMDITGSGGRWIFSEDIYLTTTARQFIGGFGAASTTGTLDWNDSTNARSGNGYSLLTGNATNGPGPAVYYHPFSFEYNAKDSTGNMTQFAIPYMSTSLTGGYYFRTRYSGTWTNWCRIISEDPTNNRVAIGSTSAANAKLEVTSTTEQLRVRYDATNYMSVTIANNGATTFNAVGSSQSFVFSDPVTITSGSITGITDIVVADGGTGRSSSTAYAVVCGGTTSTGPLQSVASVGTAGQVLTSNGAGALPTFQDSAGGSVSYGKIVATIKGLVIG